MNDTLSDEMSSDEVDAAESLAALARNRVSTSPEAEVSEYDTEDNTVSTQLTENIIVTSTSIMKPPQIPPWVDPTKPSDLEKFDPDETPPNTAKACHTKIKKLGKRLNKMIKFYEYCIEHSEKLTPVADYVNESQKFMTKQSSSLAESSHKVAEQSAELAQSKAVIKQLEADLKRKSEALLGKNNKFDSLQGKQVEILEKQVQCHEKTIKERNATIKSEDARHKDAMRDITS